MLKNWFTNNILTINATKTKYMTFTNFGTVPNIDLLLHNCTDLTKCTCIPLEKVDRHKYLGVILDNKLKWDGHIQALITRIRSYSYAFRTLRNCLAEHDLVTVYHAYIGSIIGYGITVWGGTYHTIINRLLTAQKLIIKIILKLPPYHSTENLFSRFPVLSVRHLYIKNVLKHMYRNPNSFLQRTPTSHNTRYNFMSNAAIDRPHTNWITKQTSYIATTLYNNLPSHIKFNTDKKEKSIIKCINEINVWLAKVSLQEVENLITSPYVIK